VGAYDQLQKNLALMARAGCRIELRTVLMHPNAERLPELASFIAAMLPFIDVWAIMQMENIGLIAVIVPQPAAIPIERLLTVRRPGVMRHRFIIRLLTQPLRRRPNIIHQRHLDRVPQVAQPCR
jgi:hypothetical protein